MDSNEILLDDEGIKIKEKFDKMFILFKGAFDLLKQVMENPDVPQHVKHDLGKKIKTIYEENKNIY